MQGFLHLSGYLVIDHSHGHGYDPPLAHAYSAPDPPVHVRACVRGLAGKFMSMKEVRMIEDQKDRSRKEARTATVEALRRQGTAA